MSLRHSQFLGLMQDRGQREWCILISLTELIMRRPPSQAWPWLEVPLMSWKTATTSGLVCSAGTWRVITSPSSSQGLVSGQSRVFQLACIPHPSSLPSQCLCWWQTGTILARMLPEPWSDHSYKQQKQQQKAFNQDAGITGSFWCQKNHFFPCS